MKAPSPLLLIPLILTACQTTQPDRFAVADADKDGRLSGREVNDYFVSGIFNARDTNKDGRITKMEWNPQISREDAREFDLRDADKDGAVTRGEAADYAMKRGAFRADVKAADKDKDGYVTRAEAEAYYASKE